MYSPLGIPDNSSQTSYGQKHIKICRQKTIPCMANIVPGGEKF